jgi:hypothetical protein
MECFFAFSDEMNQNTSFEQATQAVQLVTHSKQLVTQVVQKGQPVAVSNPKPTKFIPRP